MENVFDVCVKEKLPESSEEEESEEVSEGEKVVTVDDHEEIQRQNALFKSGLSMLKYIIFVYMCI